jgi:NitT/TauT family transport system permease protein
MLASAGHLNPLLVPSPATLMQQLAKHPGDFFVPLLRTIETAAIGLVAGVLAGVVAASLTWLLPVLGAVITPLALIIRSVPFVALIPVLTRVLGYTERTAWLICTLVCFFPTFVLLTTGLRDIPPNGADLFTVTGASRWDRYRRLALPASLPALATSIRIGAASSIAAALVAEFLMGVPGLALVLTNSLDGLDIPKLWAASACAAVVAVAAYLAASRLEAHVIDRWR